MHVLTESMFVEKIQSGPNNKKIVEFTKIVANYNIDQCKMVLSDQQPAAWTNIVRKPRKHHATFYRWIMLFIRTSLMKSICRSYTFIIGFCITACFYIYFGINEYNDFNLCIFYKTNNTTGDVRILTSNSPFIVEWTA